MSEPAVTLTLTLAEGELFTICDALKTQAEHFEHMSRSPRVGQNTRDIFSRLARQRRDLAHLFVESVKEQARAA